MTPTKFHLIFALNGNEDEVTTVEIDGVTYEANPDTPTEAKVGEDGKPVEYVKPEPAKEEPKDPDPKPVEVDLGKMTVEELSKKNPAVAKLIEEREDEKRLAKEAEEKKAEEDGNWQKLAEERKAKIDELTKENTGKNELIEKQNASIGNILEKVMDTIPKEKHQLIPSGFTPRQKLEYITANATLLGAKVVGTDGTVPKNDDDPNLDELAKAEKEFDELNSKESLSSTETHRFSELATIIKNLREEKEANT